MPQRKILFASGETYHIFNHSVAGIPIFGRQRESSLFLESMRFYLQQKPPTRFSFYRRSRNNFPFKLDGGIVTVINYCIMPNHFHLTLRQEREGGVTQFIQRVSNSFAHYFNLKNKTRGHVFEDKFKSVHIETEEQLLHLSRYIHLNPVTSYLVRKPEDYPYSSYNIYLGKEVSDLVDASLVLGSFSSVDKYEEFVLAQRDYQRKLAGIKHLLLEE